MQATISATALKRTSSIHFLLRYRLIQREAFIRALTCLSRYGDDLVLYADTQHFTLSATNSSLSAYCRFRYGRMFFSRYRVGGGVNGAGSSTGSPSEPRDVKGQLLVKVRFACTQFRICVNPVFVDTVVDIQAQNHRKDSRTVRPSHHRRPIRRSVSGRRGHARRQVHCALTLQTR